jgi:16S rRNA processing protein RimM
VATQDWLELGRIRGPYGVKGWVHVESYTDPPDRLLDYREWRVLSAAGEQFVPQEARTHGSGIVAKFEGVEDRDRAALLTGAVISVARSLLPQLSESEFYEADLVGMRVRNREGVELGVLQHFVATPGGSLMVIQGEGRETWVPAVPQHLTKVDMKAGLIEVDWPAEYD